MIICCISGKSGCRRIVPGQYLAIDPKGRAVMIGAVEKQKLVYILNRDSNVSPICAALHLTKPVHAKFISKALNNNSINLL